ncbi:MAG: SurA N-terminal domain-containing protein [Spirochaetales bacterium]|nr:SurA N-terminal domain-containing protein [Spirochaetales bacterium]
MSSTNDKHVKPEAKENRHKGNSFVYIGTVVLLVITIIAFVFVPAMGSMSDGGDLTFGSWDGKPISFIQGGYFSNQVQQTKAEFESQGYKDTGDQFFAYQVWRRAFENTAVHLALLDYARDAGIAVSDAYIDRKMIEHQAFQEDGAFSKRKYREATNSFKLALRKDIELSTLKSRYVSDSVSYSPSKAEIEFLSSMARSQRAIEYVAFPFNAYPDSEKLAFAKEHADLWRRARLSRVTITSSLKEAEQIREKVGNATLSFEDAAKNHSTDAYASKGGDMGPGFVWELKDDFKSDDDFNAVLSLAKGTVSDVLETPSGAWAFYRVEESTSAPDFDSDELLASVTTYMNRNEKGRIEDWIVASASSFAASAAGDFGTAATKAGFEVKETRPFPLNYGKALDIGYFSLLGALDTTGLPELNGADSDDRFLETVFTLEAGEVSEPLIVNDNALVVRLKEIRQAEDGEMSLLESYYPIVVEQAVSAELASAILKDPRLEDLFFGAFARVYSASN